MKPMPDSADLTDSGGPAAAALGRALASLPLRSAPTDLQARVFAALEARREMAWWRRPVGEWPLATRLSMSVLGLLALLPLIRLGGDLGALFEQLRQFGTLADLLAGLQAAWSTLASLKSAAAALLGHLPDWAALSLLSASLFSAIALGGTGLLLVRNLRVREYQS